VKGTLFEQLGLSVEMAVIIYVPGFVPTVTLPLPSIEASPVVPLVEAMLQVASHGVLKLTICPSFVQLFITALDDPPVIIELPILKLTEAEAEYEPTGLVVVPVTVKETVQVPQLLSANIAGLVAPLDGLAPHPLAVHE